MKKSENNYNEGIISIEEAKKWIHLAQRTKDIASNVLVIQS